MGHLFSQSDHIYCRIPAGNSKYQGRQSFQGKVKFIKQSYQALGLVDVDLIASRLCYQIPRYIRSMNGGCISIKLDKPKSPPIALIGKVLDKAMRQKCR